MFIDFKKQVLTASLRRLVVIFFLALFGVTSGQDAQAGKECVSCFSSVTDQAIKKRSVLCCKHDHVIDRSCLVHQLGSIDCLEEVLDLGLRCGGRASDGRACDERFSLSKVYRALHQRDRKAFKERIALASAPMDPAQFEVEVSNLKQRIQDAFVLSCPVEGCGNPLDRIEGCNAAQCSHYSCRQTFCYLCLVKQSSQEEAHSHVRDVHSGTFWEYRPGYLDRYHYLLVRKNLMEVFRLKVHPAVRAAAIDQLKPLLVEKKMVPFPAGVKLELWIGELESSDLNPEQKIEILQNEAIHRLNTGDEQGFEALESEITQLGGTALRTLDLPSEPRPTIAAQDELFHVERGRFYVRQVPYVSYMHGNGEDDVFQTLNWQRDGWIFWGPLFTAEGDLRFARERCRDAGGRLPTHHELWALARALGATDPERGDFSGLDPYRLPDLHSESLWGYTPEFYEDGFERDGRVYVMDSMTGIVTDLTDDWDYGQSRFRCIYE